MNILFLSHTASGGDFVVGSHHLARALGALGHTVIHLSTPVTLGHVLMAKDKFLRERVARWRSNGRKMNGFWDTVPFALLPWTLLNKLSKAPHTLFGALTAKSCQSILRTHRFSPVDLILIDEPRLTGLLRLFPTARVVYRPTDLYAQMRNDPSILSAEKHLITRAHRFIATSEPVAGHLRVLGARDVLVLENGVDLAHFLSSGTSSTMPLGGRPVAIYAGALDDRFCIESIEQTAERNPGMDIVLAGRSTPQLAERLRAHTNVRLLGPVPYTRLPDLFRSSSLGLLPLSKVPANEGRSPMKLFEYAAAGLPVVATSTPELQRRKLGFAALVHSPQDFAATVEAWMNGKLSLPDGKDEARKQDWQAKATCVLEYCR